MAELEWAGVSPHGLVDALDALLAEGVAVTGDVVIGLDGVELIKLDLRLLLAGIQGLPAGEGLT